MLTSSGNTVNNLRFVGNLGYYNEAALSLQYLRARYYQPSTGRFLSLDPLRDGVNWYVYVVNNSPNSVDPTGRQGIWPPIFWPRPRPRYKGIVRNCPTPRCDPVQERERIRERIKDLKDMLRVKPPPAWGGEGGTAPAWTTCICEDGVLKAITVCEPSFAKLPGCVQKCGLQHEQTHRHQCKVRGQNRFWELYRSNPWNLEDDAYKREVKCLEKLLKPRRWWEL